MWNYDGWLMSAADESAEERYLPDDYDPEKKNEYCITWTYEGCKYEFDYYGVLDEYEEFDKEELEFRFMKMVREGKINKGVPENLEDIEITDIWEIA